MRYSVCGLTHSLPRLGDCSYNLSLPPSLVRGTGLDPITLLAVLPNYVWIFLTAFIVQESFCQFPVNFQ